jgi:putative flippase GtrA
MAYVVRQFSSFVVVGCIATAVQFASLIGLVEKAGMPAVAAALISYAVGGVVSYGLSRRHVFRSNAPHRAAVARFTLVAAAGFGLTYLIMSLLVNGGSVPYLLAQVMTTGTVMLWNFTAHKMWTFSPYQDAQ